jgi:tetratricopeptide (TPR) repeat protein
LLLSLLPDGTIPVAEFEQRRDGDGLALFAEESVNLDTSNSDRWIVAGYAYSQGGRREQAIACYSEAVRMTPEDALGWNLLANSYRLDAQPERALQIVNRALNVSREQFRYSPPGTRVSWHLPSRELCVATCAPQCDGNMLSTGGTLHSDASRYLASE